ncbi:MAG: SAM-dependent DNA methyltransferase [Atopobiaceae bacterium]|nr:SAM-dependent DNA methyltransferase [Atopobiaceae bacterium]
MPTQVKSRQRVQEHGEVFTNEREVNAMLDMVKEETERIESRFLEPACGNGNFLAEVLRRKLATVNSHYRRNLDEWQHYAFLAVSSIYGVELLADNAQECRQRLLDIVLAEAPRETPERFGEAICFLLSKNILCGDALTMLDSSGSPITFCEWSFVREERVKRRDFQLDHMLAANKQVNEQLSLIDLMTTEYDESRNELVPKTVREYPLRNWWEVGLDG